MSGTFCTSLILCPVTGGVVATSTVYRKRTNTFRCVEDLDSPTHTQLSLYQPVFYNFYLSNFDLVGLSILSNRLPIWKSNLSSLKTLGLR
jgi:hypothetical protein